MELRAIEEQDLGSAETLLCRGFPERPRWFWRSRLAALQSYRKQAGVGPIGTLLRIKGEDVGVLLTIESPPGLGRKVNLSSWYVEDGARLAAARMLQKSVVGDAVYTDLTPTREVRLLNERIGIVPVRLGSLLAPTPIDALRLDRGRVLPFATSTAPLSDPHRQMLADHAAMGLDAAVLEADGAAMPLIFMPTRFRGLAGARVIHATSRDMLRRHRGAIARYLLGRGKLFTEIEANRDEAWSGSAFAPNRSAVFAKGPVDPHGIDHAYSELVFLHSN